MLPAASANDEKSWPYLIIKKKKTIIIYDCNKNNRLQPLQ